MNGVRSDHPVFGWGPPGEGFVFQKAFVEFFCPNADYQNKVKPTLLKHGSEEFSWFAINATGHLESSFLLSASSSPKPEDASSTIAADEEPVEVRESKGMAVTWGAFRGREITTPTIIEEVSFRAWGEEAFRIWDEWRRIYPRGSATERLLNETKNDAWLLCVIGHRYGAGTEPGSEEEKAEMNTLWNVLAGDM